MAVDDIYLVRWQLNVNKRATSCSLYYKENTPNAVNGDGQRVAAAAENMLATPLRNLLSTECTVPKWEAWRMNTPGLPGLLYVSSAPGLLGPEPLPANKALVIRMFQNDFPAKHNNRIYIPGIATVSTAGNRFEDGFMDAQVAAFRDALLMNIHDGTPGNGEWTPVCRVNQDQPFDLSNYPLLFGAAPHPVIYSQAARTRRDVSLM